jgi:hypothetical protein
MEENKKEGKSFRFSIYCIEELSVPRAGLEPARPLQDTGF